jgi:hypothetical protein
VTQRGDFAPLLKAFDFDDAHTLIVSCWPIAPAGSRDDRDQYWSQGPARPLELSRGGACGPEMAVALVAALVAKQRMLKKTRKAVARVTLLNLLF